MTKRKRCPVCNKNKDMDKTTFRESKEGSVCEDCYHDMAVIDFRNYLEELINSASPDNVIKTVAQDMGFFTNTHTQAYQKSLKFLIHMTMYNNEIEIGRDEFDTYLKESMVETDKIISALKEAGYLFDTRKGGIYRPGENAVVFAELLKSGGKPERDVIQLAYGRLNILLLKNNNNNVGWIRTILALADEIIEGKKEAGSSIADFNVHISSLFRHARKSGMKQSAVIDQMERLLGHTADSDGERKVFSDIEYRSGYKWTPDNPVWDFVLTMKPEWVSIRERMTSRGRTLTVTNKRR